MPRGWHMAPWKSGVPPSQKHVADSAEPPQPPPLPPPLYPSRQYSKTTVPLHPRLARSTYCPRKLHLWFTALYYQQCNALTASNMHSRSLPPPHQTGIPLQSQHLVTFCNNLIALSVTMRSVGAAFGRFIFPPLAETQEDADLDLLIRFTMNRFFSSIDMIL